MNYIYIKYNIKTNPELFLLWIKHYLFMKIPFKIISEYNYFKLLYPKYIKYLCNKKNKNYLILTEYDFIVGYNKNDNDDMILSNNIDTNFLEKSILIGKVFSVLVQEKNKYTAFEIPDFILYKHLDHTNYTVDGIKINGGQKISDNIVCFNMNISKVSYEKEYYYTDFFNGDKTLFYNFYETVAYNIFVNKEYKYGIIWHPKCGCSTINYFIYKYNISNIEDIYKHDLSYLYQKFRYNIYLQNFDIISFVRNPYHRFISCYIDKHINKNDAEYLVSSSYYNYLKYYNNIDSLYNFINYVKNIEYIDDHSKPISLYYYNIYNLKPIIYKIEDDLNKTINSFLTKKHGENLCNDSILCINVSSNVDVNDSNDSNDYKIFDFKNFIYNDWIDYIQKYNIIPNYNNIIDDTLFKLINIVYNEDLNKFNYNQLEYTSSDLLNNSKYKNIPDDFNPNVYKELNDDLKYFTEFQATLHYENTGHLEKHRKYKYKNIPDDFNPETYIKINNDLKHLTEIEAKIHYEYTGFQEKHRKYK